ncbi:copper chaperone [Streptomyces albus]|uniref:copper chaperone n=1 Tax=Streptomyces albus TaxID=1888 RepID=UPI0033DA42D7
MACRQCAGFAAETPAGLAGVTAVTAGAAPGTVPVNGEAPLGTAAVGAAVEGAGCEPRTGPEPGAAEAVPRQARLPRC